MRTLLIASLVLIACGDDASPGFDAGRRDSGVARTDAGGGRDSAVASDSGGGGTDSGTDAGGMSADACMPITTDPGEIGRDCADAPCPAGYTCQGFSGIVFQQTCEILCTNDCNCPTGYTCQERSDKSMRPWMECGD